MEDIIEKKEYINLNSSKNFSTLLDEKNMQFNLLKIYEEHKHDEISNIFDVLVQLDRFYNSFFVEQKFDKIKGTPIFHLYEILKDIELSELQHWSTLYEYYKQKSIFQKKLEHF